MDNDESFWSLGKPVTNFSKLSYLGSHASDTGMTSLIREDPFKDDAVQPVDWAEFVLTNLDAAESDPDTLEEYSLYDFYGNIPDDATEAAVFGLPSESDKDVYDSIVIRALDAVKPK